MQRRSRAILATLAVIAAACGDAPRVSPPLSSAPPETSRSAEATASSRSDLAEAQVLHINLGGEPASLDPAKAVEPAEIAVLHGLVRGLLAVDPDGRVVPELATALPDLSSDAKTLTFHLRDATYSNSDPIVAGDLVYSWRRVLDPRVGAMESFVMSPLAGAPELLALIRKDPAPTAAEIDALLDKLGVSAPDDKTFVVTLGAPATYFLYVAAMWLTVPLEQKWITRHDATEAGQYVSSGPFVLDTWKHESEIVLKPNPHWYGVKPTLTAIDMTMAKEPAQGQAAYEAGELDMVATPSADIRRIRADPVLSPQAADVPQLGVIYYAFNNETGPTANKDFRVALTQAVDKKAFIDATHSGVGQPANSMVMPGIRGYQADLDPYPYDLAAANHHMTRALATLGVDSVAELGRLKFGFAAGRGRDGEVAFLAEAWRQAFGLDTEQVSVELDVFLTTRTAGQYAISADGWGPDYPHASNQLGLFTCGGSDNDIQYCNRDFDALIKQANAEPDPDVQVALYDRAQTILTNDAPFLPLRFGSMTYEIKPYVGGLTVTASSAQLPGDALYETIFIKKH